MTARDIVAALGGRWCGSYGVARCPTHDDIQPSLSVKDGDNGDVVLTCFAGCDWRDVKAALRDQGIAQSGSPRDQSAKHRVYAR